MIRLLLLTSLVSSTRANSNTGLSVMALRSVDFEVFGRVQGVFFRKFTKDQAEKLKLRGWCQNTAHGTVVGQIQGPMGQVQSMVHWLKTVGSPSSQIDKAEFRNEKDILEYTYNDFSIRKD